jgi:hypothetical protein
MNVNKELALQYLQGLLSEATKLEQEWIGKGIDITSAPGLVPFKFESFYSASKVFYYKSFDVVSRIYGRRYEEIWQGELAHAHGNHGEAFHQLVVHIRNLIQLIDLPVKIPGDPAGAKPANNVELTTHNHINVATELSTLSSASSVLYRVTPRTR